MTPDQEAAMRQALEALKGYRREMNDPTPCDAEQALHAALAEPVQEPRTIRMERVDKSTSPYWWSEAARIKMPSPELYAAGDAVLCWVNEGDMLMSTPSQRTAEPVQEPERATVGPHLQKQARRLLEQLAANRPRRALDVDSTRRLLEVISAPGETDKLIADLIRSAWEWGVSCEVDDVRWGEAGDSHNQWLRDRTNDAATRLHAAMLTSGKKPNKQAEPDSPERRCGGPGCDLKCCQPVQEPVCEVIDGRGGVDWISFVPPAGTPLYTSPTLSAEPAGIVTKLVKGGVTWSRWPADMPDGTKLYAGER